MDGTDLSAQAAASADGAAGSARELMAGFPPAVADRVTLANWQDPPFNRWAFRHMRELIPSHPIPAGWRPALLPVADAGLELGAVPVARLDGSTATVAEVLGGTWTDAFVVLRDGQVIAERYD